MVYIVIFKLSKHAQEKRDILGISEEEIKSIIIKGSKWKEDKVFHSKMGGIEVVYKRIEDTIFVITLYYSE